MLNLNKVKILICDVSYGNNVLGTLNNVLGNTVSVDIVQNCGLQINSNKYDVVFISGQDFLLKKNTIESFRKDFCIPNHIMIIMSSSPHHLTLCNSQNVLCVDRNKLLRVSNFPEMQDFLIKIANRESIKNHEALWKGPHIDPVNYWKKDPHKLRYRKRARRILMVIGAFCTINLFFYGAFPEEYVDWLLSIFRTLRRIL